MHLSDRTQSVFTLLSRLILFVPPFLQLLAGAQLLPDVALDDPAQRSALEQVYLATSGPSWSISSSVSLWNTAGVSYCRWLGVSCCESTPFKLVKCSGQHSVVSLNLQRFGLIGTLPDVWTPFMELSALSVANNPSLNGQLPNSLGALDQFLWLSVVDTGIVACTDATPPKIPRTSCTLPAWLFFGPSQNISQTVSCPLPMLRSFETYTSGMDAQISSIITHPFASAAPGAVLGSEATLTGLYGCSCLPKGEHLEVEDDGSVRCKGGSDDNSKFIIAIVLVAVLPLLSVVLGIYIIIKHKSVIHELIRSREEEWYKKRSRVPGTPGVTLNQGRGLLMQSDIMVTWVFTDVADSTRLWEWSPEVMDSAIDLHNQSLRMMLDEFGGHEIRNEGDSFTISFHEACDAVRFCLQAQKTLMTAKWPSQLLEHESGCKITVGDLASTNASAAGQGEAILVGLRVRMGINTGVPREVFLHDRTELVDYRGEEYDLAGEICDLAAGGQILMGPKTFQRWNRSYKDAPPDMMQAMLMDGYRAESGPSFIGSIMNGGGMTSHIDRVGSLVKNSFSHSPKGHFTPGSYPGGSIERRTGHTIDSDDAALRTSPSQLAKASKAPGHDGGVDVSLAWHIPENEVALMRNNTGRSDVSGYAPPEQALFSIPSGRFPPNFHLPHEKAGEGEDDLVASTLSGSGLTRPPATNLLRSFTAAAPVRDYILPKAHALYSLGRRGAEPAQSSLAQKTTNRNSAAGSLPPRKASMDRSSGPSAAAAVSTAAPQGSGSTPIEHSNSSLPPLPTKPNAGVSTSHSPMSGMNLLNMKPPSIFSRVSRGLQKRASVASNDSVAQSGSTINHANSGNIPTILQSHHSGNTVRSIASYADLAAAGGSVSAISVSQRARSFTSQEARSGTSSTILDRRLSSTQAAGAFTPERPTPSSEGRFGHSGPLPATTPLLQPNRTLLQQALLYNAPQRSNPQHTNSLFLNPSSRTLGAGSYEDASCFDSFRHTRELSQHGHAASIRENSTSRGVISLIGSEWGAPHVSDPSPRPPTWSGKALSKLIHWLQLCIQPILCLLSSSCQQCLACMKVITSSEATGITPWAATNVEVKVQRSVNSYQGANLKGVVLDMGYYEWRPAQVLPMDPQGANQNSNGSVHERTDAEGHKVNVHLMQIAHASLAPRVLLFEWPLATGPNWDKLSPGFFDAPGSSRVIFPGMRELMESSTRDGSERPEVALAFSAPEGYKELCALSQELGREMLQLHNACVRETLSCCVGYECKEYNGSFMLAFLQASSAVEWALTLQLALLELPWAEELVSLEMMAEVMDPDSKVYVFRGMRCRVGIFSGRIDRVTPNVKTGRADYFGQPVNRAARLMSAAQGGQVVCEERMMLEVMKEWEQQALSVQPSPHGQDPADPSPLSLSGTKNCPQTNIPGNPAGSDTPSSPYHLRGGNDVRVARSYISTSFTKMQKERQGRRAGTPRPTSSLGGQDDSLPTPRQSALQLRGGLGHANSEMEGGGSVSSSFHQKYRGLSVAIPSSPHGQQQGGPTPSAVSLTSPSATFPETNDFQRVVSEVSSCNYSPWHPDRGALVRGSNNSWHSEVARTNSARSCRSTGGATPLSKRNQPGQSQDSSWKQFFSHPHKLAGVDPYGRMLDGKKALQGGSVFSLRTKSDGGPALGTGSITQPPSSSQSSSMQPNSPAVGDLAINGSSIELQPSCHSGHSAPPSRNPQYPSPLSHRSSRTGREHIGQASALNPIGARALSREGSGVMKTSYSDPQELLNSAEIHGAGDHRQLGRMTSNPSLPRTTPARSSELVLDVSTEPSPTATGITSHTLSTPTKTPRAGMSAASASSPQVSEEQRVSRGSRGSGDSSQLRPPFYPRHSACLNSSGRSDQVSSPWADRGSHGSFGSGVATNLSSRWSAGNSGSSGGAPSRPPSMMRSPRGGPVLQSIADLDLDCPSETLSSDLPAPRSIDSHGATTLSNGCTTSLSNGGATGGGDTPLGSGGANSFSNGGAPGGGDTPLGSVGTNSLSTGGAPRASDAPLDSGGATAASDTAQDLTGPLPPFTNRKALGDRTSSVSSTTMPLDLATRVSGEQEFPVGAPTTTGFQYRSQKSHLHNVLFASTDIASESSPSSFRRAIFNPALLDNNPTTAPASVRRPSGSSYGGSMVDSASCTSASAPSPSYYASPRPGSGKAANGGNLINASLSSNQERSHRCSRRSSGNSVAAAGVSAGGTSANWEAREPKMSHGASSLGTRMSEERLGNFRDISNRSTPTTHTTQGGSSLKKSQRLSHLRIVVPESPHGEDLITKPGSGWHAGNESMMSPRSASEAALSTPTSYLGPVSGRAGSSQFGLFGPHGKSSNLHKMTPSAKGSPALLSPSSVSATTNREGSTRPVVAECFKIRSQPSNVQDPGTPRANSITRIKYTNLNETAEPEDEEGDDGAEARVPSNAKLVPAVPVKVAVWSVGAFRLKGIAELMKVVQVLPESLKFRLDHLPKGTLDKGKARCISRNADCIKKLTIKLPDVMHLSICNMQSPENYIGSNAQMSLAPNSAWLSNPSMALHTMPDIGSESIFEETAHARHNDYGAVASGVTINSLNSYPANSYPTAAMAAQAGQAVSRRPSPLGPSTWSYNVAMPIVKNWRNSGQSSGDGMDGFMWHQMADGETALVEVSNRASPNVWNRDPEGGSSGTYVGHGLTSIQEDGRSGMPGSPDGNALAPNRGTLPHQSDKLASSINSDLERIVSTGNTSTSMKSSSLTSLPPNAQTFSPTEDFPKPLATPSPLEIPKKQCEPSTSHPHNEKDHLVQSIAEKNIDAYFASTGSISPAGPPVLAELAAGRSAGAVPAPAAGLDGRKSPSSRFWQMSDRIMSGSSPRARQASQLSGDDTPVPTVHTSNASDAVGASNRNASDAVGASNRNASDAEGASNRNASDAVGASNRNEGGGMGQNDSWANGELTSYEEGKNVSAEQLDFRLPSGSSTPSSPNMKPLSVLSPDSMSMPMKLPNSSFAERDRNGPPTKQASKRPITIAELESPTATHPAQASSLQAAGLLGDHAQHGQTDDMSTDNCGGGERGRSMNSTPVVEMDRSVDPVRDSASDAGVSLYDMLGGGSRCEGASMSGRGEVHRVSTSGTGGSSHQSPSTVQRRTSGWGELSSGERVSFYRPSRELRSSDITPDLMGFGESPGRLSNSVPDPVIEIDGELDAP